MKVNIVNLRREMAEGMNRSVYPLAQKRVEQYFDRSKRELIKSFETAKPSVELTKVAEMDRSKRSEYKDGLVENGNLYSFLGFDGDRNPVEEVKKVLEDGVQLKSLTKGSVNQQGVYVITGKVEVPALMEINERSQLSWITRGWVDAVTNGLRGLPNFLLARTSKLKAISRSGGGVQVKNNTGRNEFSPYRGNYLFEFFQRFRNKIMGRTQ